MAADEFTIAFLDVRPAFKGHVLVIARTHHQTLADLPPELVAPLFARVRAVSAAMSAAFGADSSFVGVNNTCNGAQYDASSWLEPIIEPDRWERLAAMLTDPARRTNPHNANAPRWLLSGHARCGICDDGTTVHASGMGGYGPERGSAYRCDKGSHCATPAIPADQAMAKVMIARLAQISTDLADATQIDLLPELRAPGADPARVWAGLSLPRQREIVRLLCEVTLLPGRMRQPFDPQLQMRIEWRQ